MWELQVLSLKGREPGPRVPGLGDLESSSITYNEESTVHMM